MSVLFYLPNAAPVRGGESYAGAKIYFYTTGTTDDAPVYTNNALSVAHPQPVVADAHGVFDPIYLDASVDYRCVLKTSAGTLLEDVDPFPAAFSDAASVGSLLWPQTATETLNGVTPVDYSYAPGDVRRYGGSVSLNTALTNASLSGASVYIPKGDYTLSAAVSLASGTTVEAYGATITLSGTSTRITLDSSVTWRGGKLAGPGGSYVSGNYAFYCTGTRNGAGVAPTYKSHVTIESVHIDGFGDTGVRLDYVQYAKVKDCLIENIGYIGVLGYVCTSLHVEGCGIENLAGETSSGELNAYGITFSASTSSSDFVRDPPSTFCRAVNNVITGVPTWHALDTHGGQHCDFLDNTIANCRQGVIITSRGTAGARYCRVEGNSIINTFAESETNSNGTEKREAAIWDIGVDSTARNEYNVIRDNYIYQHGASRDNNAAIITQYTRYGEVSGNILQNCYTAAIACQDYTETYTFDGNRVVDVRSIGTGSGGYTDSPICFWFAANAGLNNFNQIVVTNNTFERQNGSLDNFVGVIGFDVANTASKSAFFSNNAFCDITTPWNYAGDKTGFSGDVELSFTATGTGFSGATTGTVAYCRHGRMVTLNFPSISGTSNTTAFTFTGLPTHLIPATDRDVIARLQDNGSAAFGVARIENSGGVITLLNGVSAGGWTGSGTKGIYAQSLTYSLD